LHYLQEICYAGDIILDADGGDVFFKDAGTTFGSATNTSGNLIIKSGTTTAATFSGANVTLAGTVGSGAITSTGTVAGVAGTFSGAVSGASLTVDDVAIDGKVIVMTGSSGDTFTTTVAANGATSLVTVDTAATAAHLTIAADGTVDINSADTLTLDSAGDIVLDADGSDIFLKDAGTTFGSLRGSSGNLIIKSGTTTALTFSGANVTAAGTITGNLTGNVTGTADVATVATTVTITDNESTDESNALIFTAGGALTGGNLGLESDGDLKYNPSTSTLSVPNISITGTQTIVNSVTMNASNAVIFEGATADAEETTLTTVDATDDRTIKLPDVSGTVALFAAEASVAITSTAAELNKLDGVTATTAQINNATLTTSSTAELNLLDGVSGLVQADLTKLAAVDSTAAELNFNDGVTLGTAIASKTVTTDANIDTSGQRNLTISGELDAATLDISGAIDIAGASVLNGALTQSGGVFTQDGGAVFSEGSADVDFRVESNGNSSMFFVDGGNNHVNINHAGDLGAVFNVQAANAAIDSAGIIAVGTNNAQAVNLGGQISLGGSAVDAATGFAQFGTIAGRKENGTSANYAGYLAFGTLSAGGTNQERMRISSTGVATFTSVVDITGTTDSSDASGDTGILRVEGGASIAKKLYIGTDLDVDGTANLDVVDIDGAVNIATTALVTGVLTTTATPIFNGGFTSNNDSIINTTDNGVNLTLQSTDDDASGGPQLLLRRHSGSPADGDVLGRIEFHGQDDNDQQEDLVILEAIFADVSNGSEDAQFNIDTKIAGTNRSRIEMLPTETVFNEDSVDLDFRVESDNDTHALFVQGSNGYVGMSQATPVTYLDIKKTDGADEGIGVIRVLTTNGGTIATDMGGQINFSYQWENSGTLLANSPYIKAVKTNANEEYGGGLAFGTRVQGSSQAERLRITDDGRGLSQFTAKAWVNFNGVGTVAINDSHNISSVTDVAGGRMQPNFANNLANINYAVVASCSTENSGNTGMFAMTNTSHTGASSINNVASHFFITTARTGAADATEADSPFIHAIVFGD